MRLWLVALLFAANTPSVDGAVGPSGVLVLYNSSSPDSVAVANYYAQSRPGVQLLGLSGITTDEEVTADYYLQNIRPQILPALNSSTSCVVTTKGLPLRIKVTEANPGYYVDPFGVTRITSGTGWWKSYSSLESELTRITTVSTWQQMGDQYFSNPLPTSPPPASKNPFYLQTAGPSVSYSPASYGGVLLTSRLDGYTVANIKSAVDKAKRAFVLPGGRQFVLDDDPNVSYDRMVELKNNVLTPSNQPVAYDNTTAPVLTAPGPVMGYVSHGVHSSGLAPNYVTGQLGFSLADGAVFETHESFDAFSFNPSGNTMGQGQLAQWIAIGGTAGVGNVQEPLAGKNYEANEDQLFKMLLNGNTWAESAWSSLRQLSYVNTVVGDPLMIWKPVLPGDANLDGRVNSTDLSMVSASLGRRGCPGGFIWNLGDFDCDGRITQLDLDIATANLGQVSTWAEPITTIGPGPILGPAPVNGGGSLQTVPEPGSIMILAAGIVAAGFGGAIHFRRSRLPRCGRHLAAHVATA
jgi:uncharacterized protein (TIGR03790 family)